MQHIRRDEPQVSSLSRSTDPGSRGVYREDLLRGIYAYGFEHPSTIQQRAIVPMSKGKDILAQSQSGTGKTATFLIGSLMQVTSDYAEYPQILIITPTRELALQIQNVSNTKVYPIHKCIKFKCGRFLLTVGVSVAD